MAWVRIAIVAGLGLVPFGTRAADRIVASPHAEPIIGGEPTEPGEFDNVVGVAIGDIFCSGTFVSSRVLLTAAHCLSSARTTADVRVVYGDTIHSFDPVAAVDYGTHPDYCGVQCPRGADASDYAYVSIGVDFTVPSGFVAPIATQEEWDEAMVPGHEVTLVGYGGIDNEGTDLGIKRKVTTTIDYLSHDGGEFFAGGHQQDTCRGDSGGPAFARVGDGTWRLAGITSRGSDPCGNGGLYGAPYPSLCWLADKTGVDLRRDGCSTCDCLDMAPENDDGGCSCSSHPEPPSPALLFAAVALRRRRRRAGRDTYQ